MNEPTPATTGDQTTEQVRDFVAWLVEHNGGRTATAASIALADVARAVDDHQRPGTVTLRITMKPAAPGLTTIGVKVHSAAPAEPPAESIFFVDGRGNLTRQDPKQLTFDPRGGAA